MVTILIRVQMQMISCNTEVDGRQLKGMFLAKKPRRVFCFH